MEETFEQYEQDMMDARYFIEEFYEDLDFGFEDYEDDYDPFDNETEFQNADGTNYYTGE